MAQKLKSISTKDTLNVSQDYSTSPAREIPDSQSGTTQAAVEPWVEATEAQIVQHSYEHLKGQSGKGFTRLQQVFDDLYDATPQKASQKVPLKPAHLSQAEKDCDASQTHLMRDAEGAIPRAVHEPRSTATTAIPSKMRLVTEVSLVHTGSPQGHAAATTSDNRRGGSSTGESNTSTCTLTAKSTTSPTDFMSSAVKVSKLSQAQPMAGGSLARLRERRGEGISQSIGVNIPASHTAPKQLARPLANGNNGEASRKAGQESIPVTSQAPASRKRKSDTQTASKAITNRKRTKWTTSTATNPAPKKKSDSCHAALGMSARVARATPRTDARKASGPRKSLRLLQADKSSELQPANSSDDGVAEAQPELSVQQKEIKAHSNVVVCALQDRQQGNAENNPEENSDGSQPPNKRRHVPVANNYKTDNIGNTGNTQDTALVISDCEESSPIPKDMSPEVPGQEPIAPPKTPAALRSSPPNEIGFVDDDDAEMFEQAARSSKKANIISFGKSGPRNQGLRTSRTPGTKPGRSSMPADNMRWPAGTMPGKGQSRSSVPHSRRLLAKGHRDPSSGTTSKHATKAPLQAKSSNVAGSFSQALGDLYRKPHAAEKRRDIEPASNDGFLWPSIDDDDSPDDRSVTEEMATAAVDSAVSQPDRPGLAGSSHALQMFPRPLEHGWVSAQKISDRRIAPIQPRSNMPPPPAKTPEVEAAAATLQPRFVEHKQLAKRRTAGKPSRHVSQGSQTVDMLGSPVPQGMEMDDTTQTVLETFSRREEAARVQLVTTTSTARIRHTPKLDNIEDESIGLAHNVPPPQGQHIMSSNTKPVPRSPRANHTALTTIRVSESQSKQMLVSDNHAHMLNDPFTESGDWSGNGSRIISSAAVTALQQKLSHQRENKVKPHLRSSKAALSPAVLAEDDVADYAGKTIKPTPAREVAAKLVVSRESDAAILSEVGSEIPSDVQLISRTIVAPTTRPKVKNVKTKPQVGPPTSADTPFARRLQERMTRFPYAGTTGEAEEEDSEKTLVAHEGAISGKSELVGSETGSPRYPIQPGVKDDGRDAAKHELIAWTATLEPHQVRLFDQMVVCVQRLSKLMFEQEKGTEQMLDEYCRRNLYLIEQEEKQRVNNYQQMQKNLRLRRKEKLAEAQEYYSSLLSQAEDFHRDRKQQNTRMAVWKSTNNELEAFINELL